MLHIVALVKGYASISKDGSENQHPVCMEYTHTSQSNMDKHTALQAMAASVAFLLRGVTDVVPCKVVPNRVASKVFFKPFTKIPRRSFNTR